MAVDNAKVIKELLEIINTKTGKIEMRQSIQTTQITLINEKLDEIGTDVKGLELKFGGLKKDIKELDEKADLILEFAEDVDNDVQERLGRIEMIPTIALSLNK